MFAENKMIRSALAILTALAASAAVAQEVNIPESVAGKTAAQVQAMPDSVGSAFVVGPPRQEVVDEKGLVYRDPSEPLSVGEMAEIQKDKAIKDFLKRAGFTTVQPAPPPVPEPEKAPERMESVLQVKSLFARDEGRPFAEISTNSGALLKVEHGYVISKRLSVIDVDGRQLTISVSPELPASCSSKRASKSRKAECNVKPSMVVLQAGDEFRWFD